MERACYTIDSKNVLIISAFKENCAINFFKGALLSDKHGLLEKPGENSQSARFVRMRSVAEVRQLEPQLKEIILEAIEVERSGQKVDFKAKHELVIPEELDRKFAELPALRAAFAALTPGRQRGYILYFTAPSNPRPARVASTNACLRFSKVAACMIEKACSSESIDQPPGASAFGSLNPKRQ